MPFTCLGVARSALGEPEGIKGDEHYWTCPNHDDKHPSLQVNGKKNKWMCAPCAAQGKAWKLATFLSGYSYDNDPSNLIAWLNQHGLRDGDNGQPAVVSEYIYQDAGSKPTLKILRYDPKGFKQQRWNGTEWDWEGQKPKLLYHLPELLAEPKRLVLLCEGEKDADRLRSLGFLATTNPIGAGKWDKSYTETLKGHPVAILPDNDPSGHSHAAKVALALFKAGCEVRVVEPPGLKEKEDVSDWLGPGHVSLDLKSLIRDTPVLDETALKQLEGRWLAERPQQQTSPIAEILTKAGFDELTKDSPLDDIEKVVLSLSHQLKGADQLRRVATQEAATKLLKKVGINAPTRLLDAVLKVQDQQPGKGGMEEQQLEPWPEPVNGAELLDEIRGWISGYVFAPEESINSIALWSVATWFVEFTYFAPLLTLLSPTIQSGKTLIIDLLEWICRETVRTSGVGITPAVIFRLNEKRQPTFLIDEAEKLSGPTADMGIIGLLNEGYRRGGKVQRCGDKSTNFEVEEFDAFGFRLLASTKKLWGSIIDRSIIVRISRKPRSQTMRRFVGRKVKAEGGVLAQKILRFAQDNSKEFEALQITTPRPQWLADRACDNWSPLFTVAELAGGDWSEKTVNSAKLLCASAEENDRAEQLIHDTYRIFKDEGWPEVIKSGDLAAALNKIESSPWSEYGRGKGLTPTKIATMFRTFEIRPDQRRDSGGKVIRGYWQNDLEDTFKGYIPPSELVQVVQPNKDGGSSDSQSGTEKEPCTTSKSPETRSSTESVPLYHPERGDTEETPSEGDL